MTVSAEYRERNRIAILRAAARLFRAHGYAGVNVDRIMAEAGLTRGTFYTYFGSKQALFTEALAFQPDFRRRLSERDAEGDLPVQAASIVADYLNPAHRHLTWPGCSLASLSQDAARADKQDAREQFAVMTAELTAEFQRGLDDETEALKAMIMAVGGLMLARACESTPMADKIAAAAEAGATETLTKAQSAASG